MNATCSHSDSITITEFADEIAEATALVAKRIRADRRTSA
jgi:hypothetical protein